MSKLTLRSRRPFRVFHVWIGLIFGLILALYSLSGALLVFRAEIDRASQPQWVSKSSARPESPLAAAAMNIGRKWPGSRINRISFDRSPDVPLEFSVHTAAGDNLRVFTSPQSGEVFGTFRLPWLEFITELHHNLLLGPAGRRLTGVIGLALFLTSLSGLLIWLFRKPSLAGVLQVHIGGSSQRFNFDLHKATGLVAYSMLLIVSVTGICLAYPNTIRVMFEANSRSIDRKQTKLGKADRPVTKPLSFSTYAAAALKAIPGSQLFEIRPGGPGRRSVTVRVWLPGDLRPEGSNDVLLDVQSGRVLAVDKASDWHSGKTLNEAVTPIHFVEWGGLPLKIVWSLLGLTPTFLFGSGLLLWWGPYRNRRKVARGTPQREAAAVSS